MTAAQLDTVADLIREAAASIVLPLWQSLTPDQIREKNPGDLVTEADLRSEAWLTARLQALDPGSVVIGEEAVSRDPALLDRIADDNSVWIIDPVDGTANFAVGKPKFAIIVAQVERGRTVAGWIYAPVQDRMAIAEAGGGVRVDGRMVSAPGSAGDGEPVSGYLVPSMRPAVAARPDLFGDVHGTTSAGCEYIELMTGGTGFSAYSRLKPWDHAAGSLMVREAGGVSQLLNGGDYGPRIRAGRLLNATRASVWTRVSEALTADLGR